MMKLPLNFMPEILDDDDRDGPYDDLWERWDGNGLGGEMNGVHFILKSGIACLHHKELTLVELEE